MAVKGEGGGERGRNENSPWGLTKSRSAAALMVD